MSTLSGLQYAIVYIYIYHITSISICLMIDLEHSSFLSWLNSWFNPPSLWVVILDNRLWRHRTSSREVGTRPESAKFETTSEWMLCKSKEVEENELKNAEGRRERKWSGLSLQEVRVRRQYLLLELVRVKLSSSSPWLPFFLVFVSRPFLTSLPYVVN